MRRVLYIAKILTFVGSFLFLAPWSLFSGTVQESVWQTTYNLMYFIQDGSTVSGVYIYDGGVITGTMNGQDFQGYWRESGNTKACGPGNAWSGPVVFRFLPDNLSFTGDWGYCDETFQNLNPDGGAWTGNRRVGSDTYTEAECTSAGWSWCDSTCQMQTCGTQVTQQQCEGSGWLWCDGTCQLSICEDGVDITPIRAFLLLLSE